MTRLTSVHRGYENHMSLNTYTCFESNTAALFFPLVCAINDRQGAEYGTTKSCLQGGGEIITIAGEAFGSANAKVNYCIRHISAYQQKFSVLFSECRIRMSVLRAGATLLRSSG